MTKKKLPELLGDEAAEAFVQASDLSRYDLTTMVPVQFEQRPKHKAMSLRLP